MIYVSLVLFAPLLHELGHFLMALAFGHRLKFERRGWRFVWDMPKVERWKQKAIALAGFGVELAAAPFFYAWNAECGLAYHVAATLHLLLYAGYAGREYNDFKWFFEEGEWDR